MSVFGKCAFVVKERGLCVTRSWMRHTNGFWTLQNAMAPFQVKLPEGKATVKRYGLQLSHFLTTVSGVTLSHTLARTEIVLLSAFVFREFLDVS